MPAHFFRRFYVERSVGFAGYDVDRGCFMIGAPLWIPAFAGMTKKDQSPRSHRFPPFLQNTPAIPAKRSPPFLQNARRHSRKMLSVIPAKRSLSFPQNTLRHSREGGNPLSITVIHTGVRFLNQPNLPCLPIFSGDSM